MKFAMCSFLALSVLGLSAAPEATVTSVVPNGAGIKVSYTLTGGPAVVTLSLAHGGVPLPDADLACVGGDVNALVQPGERTIAWTPAPNRPVTRYEPSALSASVRVWPTDSPPDYMVVDLVYTNAVRYYTSTNAFPHPVTSSRYKTDFLVMRRIPAAGVTWRMGSPTDEAGRTAANEASRYVRLDSDYYIGIYEMTEGQFYRVFRDCAGNASAAGGNAFRVLINDGTDVNEYPFCNYSYVNVRGGDSATANAKVWPADDHALGTPSSTRCWLGYFRQYLGIDFDLPTEPQWEFACRGGAGGAAPPADLDAYAWYADNSKTGTAKGELYFPRPVGLKRPNGYGLYDMLGNALELCLDYFQTVTQPDDPATTVVSAKELQVADDGSHTVVSRGGSYATLAVACRPAWRSKGNWAVWNWGVVPSAVAAESAAGSVRDKAIGFRLACPGKAVR